MTEFNQDFTDYIKDYVRYNLCELEGTTVYGCDLATTLTDYDNANGSPFVLTSEARDFISTYKSEADEVYDDLVFNFGKEYAQKFDPHDEPDGFSFMMIQYGVNNLLSTCNYLEEPNWNGEITLTKPVINQISKECGISFREERFGLEDCTVDEIHQLKETYLTENYDEFNDEKGVGPSYGELGAADEIVSDEILKENYDGYSFVNDDFWCNMNQGAYSTARATSGENRSNKTEDDRTTTKDEVL